MRTKNIVFGAVMLLILWGWWADASSEIADVFISDAQRGRMAIAGAWGDSFGPFNALVSTAGFVTVLATLMMQSKALRDQAADLHRQRFESSFYELLRLMRQLRGEISFQHSKDYIAALKAKSPIAKAVPNPRFSGMKAVQQTIREIVFWIIQGKIGTKPSKEKISAIYMEKIHGTSEATFAPYFRIIYSILAKIKNDKVLTDEEKENYSNLLRSQLTTYEITLLAINALAPVAKDLAQLIAHFRMLKYLPENAMRRRLINLYPPEAFAPRS